MHKAVHPLHVTMRAPEVASLRREYVFACVEEQIAAGQKDSFRVIHFSVQGDHVHLLVEASDERALSAGVRGIPVRIARSVNRCLGRRGQFWIDRYHA